MKTFPFSTMALFNTLHRFSRWNILHNLKITGSWIRCICGHYLRLCQRRRRQYEHYRLLRLLERPAEELWLEDHRWWTQWRQDRGGCGASRHVFHLRCWHGLGKQSAGKILYSFLWTDVRCLKDLKTHK